MTDFLNDESPAVVPQVEDESTAKLVADLSTKEPEATNATPEE